MKYARIINDTAVDVRVESPDGFFTPNIAAEFVNVPDSVEDGWILNGTVWSSPPAPGPVAPPAPFLPKVSPVEFKLLFTSAERVAIKASTDPVVLDFFSIVEDQRLTHVDLALQSTQDALSYLESKALIAVGRKAAILTGMLV